MYPLLLPIVLIMYGEFSREVHTRFISRVLFYSYAFSYFIGEELSSDLKHQVLTNVMLVAGLGYVIIRCRNVLSVVPFTLAALCVILNTASIFLGDYTFLLSIPYYADYSHIIIRESILAGVAAFAIWNTYNLERDYRLTVITFWMWVVEGILIR